MPRSRLLAPAVPVLGGLCAVAACAAAAPTYPVSPATPRSAPSELPAPAASASAAAPDAGGVAQESPDAAPLASVTDAGPPGDASSERPSACNDQPPQDFLVRGNFLKVPGGNQRAIQYRTDTYGFFPGFGRPGPGARPVGDSIVETTFMALPVRMNRKVVPALACVEAEIRAACVDHPYTAHALAGVRTKNTYRGGEVTNHIYGIAIDVDPVRNTCCGCVKPWNDAPRCRRPAKTEYDRMEMPECWVHAFERFGFYWLGHDVLQDTMHYEFLGDPDHILKTPEAAGAGPGPRDTNLGTATGSSDAGH
jgi:hypothetical protein